MTMSSRSLNGILTALLVIYLTALVAAAPELLQRWPLVAEQLVTRPQRGWIETILVRHPMLIWFFPPISLLALHVSRRAFAGRALPHWMQNAEERRFLALPQAAREPVEELRRRGIAWVGMLVTFAS